MYRSPSGMLWALADGTGVWRSPAAFLQELHAWGPVPTCTLSTPLTEGGGTAQLPQALACLPHSFGTCFLCAAPVSVPPRARGRQVWSTFAGPRASPALPTSVPMTCYIYTPSQEEKMPSAWHAEAEKEERMEPADRSSRRLHRKSPRVLSSPLRQGSFLAPGSQCASSMCGELGVLRT